MRAIKLVLIAGGVVLALCALGVSSASAVQLPLFVSKSGIYPQHVLIHGSLGKLNTTSGHEIHCTLISGLGLINLRLGLLLATLYKCSTTILFSKPECRSAGEPKGLISLHLRAWLGYLTNAVGEKMVGLLGQGEPGKTIGLFECEANALEKTHIEILGEVVGAIPAIELNSSLAKFNADFEQIGGKQAVQTFLLPEPLSLMTGVHPTLDITGSVKETTEAALEGMGEATLLGGETAEIQG